MDYTACQCSSTKKQSGCTQEVRRMKMFSASFCLQHALGRLILQAHFASIVGGT